MNKSQINSHAVKSVTLFFHVYFVPTAISSPNLRLCAQKIPTIPNGIHMTIIMPKNHAHGYLGDNRIQRRKMKPLVMIRGGCVGRQTKTTAASANILPRNVVHLCSGQPQEYLQFSIIINRILQKLYKAPPFFCISLFHAGCDQIIRGVGSSLILVNVRMYMDLL